MKGWNNTWMRFGKSANNDTKRFDKDAPYILSGQAAMDKIGGIMDSVSGGGGGGSASSGGGGQTTTTYYEEPAQSQQYYQQQQPMYAQSYQSPPPQQYQQSYQGYQYY